MFKCLHSSYDAVHPSAAAAVCTDTVNLN